MSKQTKHTANDVKEDMAYIGRSVAVVRDYANGIKDAELQTKLDKVEAEIDGVVKHLNVKLGIG